MYPLLAGLRVVEAASFIAAPSCALHMVQMGAEVIRLDQIGGGPDYNRWPLVPGSDRSLYWEGLNKGKKSVAIDFTRPEGRALAAQVITAPGENAGLFVTNFPVSGFLSHQRLRALRDDLISLRVMGWSDGRPALDYTVNAAVGLPLITGPVGADGPVNHVLPAWDLLTGAYGAFSLLAAERFRRAGGGGQEIRLPLSDVAIGSVGHLGMLAEAAGGAERPRLGNDLFGAFGRDFTVSGGTRVIVVAITPRQWSGLVGILGLGDAVAALEAELGADFSRDEGARFAHRARLYPLFAAAFKRKTLAELIPGFEQQGVCWGRYQTLADGLAHDPALSAANPLLAPVRHPGGEYLTPGTMATLPDLARGVPGAAPALGRDTDQVLAETLDRYCGDWNRERVFRNGLDM